MKKTFLILLMAGWTGAGFAGEAGVLPDPLTWDDCVQYALAHNTDLLQAEAQLEEARGAKLEFRSNALPQAQATALTFPPLVVLNVNQMIFDQRAILAWEASDLAGEVARLNYELRLNEVMSSLRLAYLNVLLIQQREQLTRELKGFLEKRRQNAQSMFDTGRLRKSELEQVNVRLSLIRDALTLLLEQRKSSKIQLLGILGTGNSMGKLGGDFEALPERQVDLARVVEVGLTGMPEIRLLDKLAESSAYEARIARAERYPNLYLYGRLDYSPGLDQILGTAKRTKDTTTSSVTDTATAVGGGVAGGLAGAGTGSTGSTGSTTDPTGDTTGLGEVNSEQSSRNGKDDEFEKSRGLFGFRLKWNAYDGGESEGKALRKDANRNESLVRAVEFRQILPGQAQEAVTGIETAREIIKSNQTLPTFKEALNMAQSEYEGGRSGQNETLAFALDSFNIHTRLIEARYRANVGLTILRRISGQLLSFSENSSK